MPEGFRPVLAVGLIEAYGRALGAALTVPADERSFGTTSVDAVTGRQQRTTSARAVKEIQVYTRLVHALLPLLEHRLEAFSSAELSRVTKALVGGPGVQQLPQVSGLLATIQQCELARCMEDRALEKRLVGASGGPDGGERVPAHGPVSSGPVERFMSPAAVDALADEMVTMARSGTVLHPFFYSVGERLWRYLRDGRWTEVEGWVRNGIMSKVAWSFSVAGILHPPLVRAITDEVVRAQAKGFGQPDKLVNLMWAVGKQRNLLEVAMWESGVENLRRARKEAKSPGELRDMLMPMLEEGQLERKDVEDILEQADQAFIRRRIRERAHSDANGDASGAAATEATGAERDRQLTLGYFQQKDQLRSVGPSVPDERKLLYSRREPVPYVEARKARLLGDLGEFWQVTGRKFLNQVGDHQ